MTSHEPTRHRRPEARPRATLAVVAEAGDVAMDWAPLVAALARTFDLEVADVGPGRAEPGRRADPVGLAAAMPGPTLVLPSRLGHRARRRDGATAPVLERVLVPSDAGDELARASATLVGALGRSGVAVTVLHVVTDDNRPRMWEGAGHHAVQWFEELAARHGCAGPSLRVVAGSPRREIAMHSASVDLVLVPWHHIAADGRAPVVRALLDGELDVPVLLAPLAWVGTLASGAPARRRLVR